MRFRSVPPQPRHALTDSVERAAAEVDPQVCKEHVLARGPPRDESSIRPAAIVANEQDPRLAFGCTIRKVLQCEPRGLHGLRLAASEDFAVDDRGRHAPQLLDHLLLNGGLAEQEPSEERMFVIGARSDLRDACGHVTQDGEQWPAAEWPVFPRLIPVAGSRGENEKMTGAL